MLLLGHFLSSLKGHGKQERFPRTGKSPVSLQSTDRTRWKILGTARQSALHLWEGNGTSNPGFHL